MIERQPNWGHNAGDIPMDCLVGFGERGIVQRKQEGGFYPVDTPHDRKDWVGPYDKNDPYLVGFDNFITNVRQNINVLVTVCNPTLSSVDLDGYHARYVYAGGYIYMRCWCDDPALKKSEGKIRQEVVATYNVEGVGKVDVVADFTGDELDSYDLFDQEGGCLNEGSPMIDYDDTPTAEQVTSFLASIGVLKVVYKHVIQMTIYSADKLDESALRRAGEMAEYIDTGDGVGKVEVLNYGEALTVSQAADALEEIGSDIGFFFNEEDED